MPNYQDDVTETQLYVPLRGNAYGLLAGAPAAAFVRSLKVAAVMHDQLFLDEGSWSGIAGPGGKTEWRDPQGTGPGGLTLQPPRERAASRGRDWHIAMRPSDSEGPMRAIIRSSTTLSVRATFEPIRQSLPRAFEWIDFVSHDLYPDDKRLTKRLASAEVRDGLLSEAFPDRFTRSLIAESTMHSLVLGMRMGAAVRLDGLHRSVLAARLARGEARPTLGGHALVATIPDVRNLPWEEVDEVRKMKGIPRLRAILADVEMAALEATAEGGDLDEAILREYHEQYRRATDDAGWTGHAVSVLLGAATSVATTPLAGPAGIVVGVGMAAATETGSYFLRKRRRRDTWMAAADDLRARATRSHGDSN